MAMLRVPRPIGQNLIESPVKEYLYAVIHLPQLSAGNTLSINDLQPELRTDIQSVERCMRRIAPVPILQCSEYWTSLSDLFPNKSLEGLLKNISAPTFLPEIRIGNVPNCGCGSSVAGEPPTILDMPGMAEPANISTVFNKWKRNITCWHCCEHPVVLSYMECMRYVIPLKHIGLDKMEDGINCELVLILSIAPGTVTFDNIDIADCIEEGQDDAGDDTTYVHVGSIYKSQDFKPTLEVFNQNPSWHHGWLRYSDDRVEQSAEAKTLDVTIWCFAFYLRRSSLKDRAKIRQRAKADMPMGRMMGEASSRYVGMNVETVQGHKQH